MKTIIRQFRPRALFDFDLSAAFATYGGGRYAADSFEDGRFRRAVESEGGPVLVTVESQGSVSEPLLNIRLSGESLSSSTADRLTETGSRLVGAHVDLVPFYDAVKHDDAVSLLAGRFYGLGIPQAATPFEAIVLAILGQQISGHVARVLRETIVDRLGDSVEFGGTVYRTFPSPGAIAEAGPERLRSIRLSARKSEYIYDIAAQTVSGDLDLDCLADLPADEIVSELVKLRGVGPWTAHWLVIRAYGLSDGFPHGDLAVQRSLGLLHNRGRLSAGEALDLSYRWSPYRSYLTTYLFAAARAGVLGDLPGARSVGP